MTDWPPGRGTAASPAVVPALAAAPAPDAPLAGRAALGAGTLPAAARPSTAEVPEVDPAAEHPAASTDAPAASRTACMAAWRRGGGAKTWCAGAVMPMGRG